MTEQPDPEKPRSGELPKGYEYATSLSTRYDWVHFWKSAVPISFFSAFGSALYPILANQVGLKSPPILIGIVATYALAIIIVTILRLGRNRAEIQGLASSYQELAADYQRLADYTRHSLEQFNDLVVEMDEITNVETDAIRRDVPQPVRTAAIDLLVDALKEPLQKALADPGITDHYDPGELREYLYSLLQYCALLLERDPASNDVRCGLLLRLPPEKRQFIPMLTYLPNHRGYVSTNYIPPGERPDWLLQRFEFHKDGFALDRNCFDCIPDTDEYLRDEGRVMESRYRPKDLVQSQYIKSILGVVIYARGKNELATPRALAVLSFDSPTPNALTEERYLAALPMLRLAYRILGIRLASIVDNREMIMSIYQGTGEPRALEASGRQPASSTADSFPDDLT